MLRIETITIAAALFIAVGCLTVVSADDMKPVQVTVDNFRRAETDTYFA
jgi:hypothetical protein